MPTFISSTLEKIEHYEYKNRFCEHAKAVFFFASFVHNYFHNKMVRRVKLGVRREKVGVRRVL